MLALLGMRALPLKGDENVAYLCNTNPVLFLQPSVLIITNIAGDFHGEVGIFNWIRI